MTKDWLKGNKFNQKTEEERTSFLHIRITPTQKGKYIAAAKNSSLNLTTWVENTLDKKVKAMEENIVIDDV